MRLLMRLLSSVMWLLSLYNEANGVLDEVTLVFHKKNFIKGRNFNKVIERGLFYFYGVTGGGVFVGVPPEKN